MSSLEWDWRRPSLLITPSVKSGRSQCHGNNLQQLCRDPLPENALKAEVESTEPSFLIDLFCSKESILLEAEEASDPAQPMFGSTARLYHQRLTRSLPEFSHVLEKIAVALSPSVLCNASAIQCSKNSYAVVLDRGFVLALRAIVRSCLHFSAVFYHKAEYPDEA